MQVKTMLGSVVLCTLLAACGGNGAPPQSPPSQADEPLSAKVERFRAMSGVPGVVVVVVDHGKVEVATSGVRRAGAPAPVGRDDRFQIGSLTKAMTATLMARLVEQGKLRWDATLSDLFPAWRTQMRPEYLGVTVAQLLQHRAGLARDFIDTNLDGLQDRLTGNPQADRAAAGLWFLQQVPRSTPGSKFEYSNIGYLLAGLITEAVGNDTYENLMAREVLQPLQLNAAFGMPEDAGGQAPAGHLEGAQGWRVAAYPAFMDNEPEFRRWLFAVAPAGGVSVSAPDYGRFLLEQLHGLQGHSTLLTQADYQLMHTPAEGYGYGWVVGNHPTLGAVSFHNGSVGTYYAANRMVPGQNRAVAVMCNCDSPAAEAKIDEFLNGLIGADGK